MTLRRRITQLEGRAPARIVADAGERLMAYLDRIAARLPITTVTPKATAADLQSELITILQRPMP
jgi:hypothetical protein